MVIGYLECPTGIAGDMCLGALVDAGVPLEYVIEQLKKLDIQHPYQLNSKKVTRNGQRATKIEVEIPHDSNTQRHLPEIEQLITTAALPPKATAWSLKVFHQLAKAEGRVHGILPEQVHFHEVGALDAIIDIVGTCLGLDWLKIHQLHCSPMPTGRDTVKTAHGLLPVPVPAVLQLWQTRQVPIYHNNLEGELVTPTGAAIAVALADSFGTPPPMNLQTIGLGAGTKELPLPNILRLWLGETVEEKNTDTIVVLSTQIDDFSPQGIAYTCEQLLQEGVLDVFTQSIAMKKWRSGILLTVICYPEQVTTCETIIFRETTTLGIRRSIQSRTILEREIQEVQTIYGKIRVKVASFGEGNNKQIINVQPEYEDCAAIARQSNQPWQNIRKLALKYYYVKE
ncbi:MAG: nickel pincer cofactor biosynthesis protein LarC [Prochloron sp. SP5CPC1]|nr:nickel pincer cofactor biosynthesis protein LarC [Candidatus Paraprochloron terpiosi SP5CPC1]